ncbi:hypothetical protein SNE40_009751 [Patella caerulea]|uniref:Reverse transcriptase RNase H-like domain-containing protein n=1 Tax=Patella caerulea TaxID=87958 RepID=A0AAN8PYX6_PATCE
MVPTCTREAESFLGFANYHRTFIKHFAEKAFPLYQITGKKTFVWGPEQQSAFDKLKHSLVTTPVLTLPNTTDPFILDCDASINSIGAELSQVQDGQERVIAYSSFSLTPEQRRYCATRLELLAIVRFTRQFRHYLLGKQFRIRTDHNSLTWLLKFKQPTGQLARWLEELSQYDMVIEYRKAQNHQNADALSRMNLSDRPCSNFDINIKVTDLPCGGCHYCQIAHKNWIDFATNVDDVRPLSFKENITVNEPVNPPLVF